MVNSSRVDFLKVLINDTVTGDKKSWHTYHNMFPNLGRDGEQLRGIWRTFKRTLLPKGLWGNGEVIDDYWMELCNKAAYSSSPQSPEESLVLSAIKEDGTIMCIEEYCEVYNIPFEHVKSYKIVTHNGKAPYYNIQSKDISLSSDVFEDFAKKLLEDLSNLDSLPKTIVRDEVEDGHLLIVDPADIHIGKLASAFETGEDYNSQIAVQRVIEGVEGLLNKSRGFQINKILFIGGNDILHIDTPKRTTTSGTPQDTHLMWYDNFLIAKQLYIDLLTRLLEVADVHFVFNPSNHDYQSGFFLADVIQTYFRNVENITFDCNISHRKYFTYGDNLIGTTHGDGAKTETLPMLMAVEAKDWSSCKHRYMYTHHIHHKTLKDFPGVTVESLRSPSSTDSWHHRQGFQHNPKAVEGFLHHPKYGQVAKLVHLF